MAYANSHVKITLFGTTCGGAEEWSTGFRIGLEDSGSGIFDIDTAWVDAVAVAWETAYESTTLGVASAVKCVGVKAALILADGTTDVDAGYTKSYTTPLNGGAITSQALPPQVALVAQLAAASPVGLGAKGRMYIPGVNFPIDGGTGKITGAAALGVATTLRTFFDAIEDATDSPGVVMNVSKGRVGIPFAAPVNKRVVTVRVGDVYDTQRRRRNGLSETYQSATLAA